MKNAHSKTSEELISHLKSNSRDGLSTNEATLRLTVSGKNLLTKKKETSVLKIILNQFADPVIYILGTAFFLSLLFGELLEAMAILLVILITITIGFFMEWQAKKSVEALQKMVNSFAQVVRDGKIQKIKTEDLVPGDIILLQSGDITPADARILEHTSLAVKEGILTGESNQTEKNLEVFPEKTAIIDQSNMVFKGTVISRGNAKALVTSTGDDTVVGKINALTHSAEKEITPLEKKLQNLSRWLVWFTVIIMVVIIISGYIQGKDLLLMIKTAIALAVAAIPEGLPVVATITLARGMLKLSKQQVIIKKLEAVETLGSTNIICTDKTGTLTENKMEVHKIAYANRILNADKIGVEELLCQLKEEDAFKKLIKTAVLCNSIYSEANLEQGDPVETALLEFASRCQFDIWSIKKNSQEIAQIPFDTENKLMLTINKKNKTYVNVKGAPESILNLCSSELTHDGIIPMKNVAIWEKAAQDFANEGLRVLGLAYKLQDPTKLEKDHFLKNLIFIGLVGFLDPPRADIYDAIQTYKDAGIKVVMVTGDHPDTARKIGQEIGLISNHKNTAEVILGTEIVDLENLTSTQENKMLTASIFSRMVPKQKLDLIAFYQAHNCVVGMIGDGVNDAPALKKADIGIAMGIRGTEAAKEAADVILMDDKFTSTELAIKQGRIIFENIRHFVVFLLSCNLAEIISVAIAAFTFLPLPLLPLQILYLNLITDIFPALALGMGKGDKSIMLRGPRDPKEHLITKKLWIATIVYGLVITFCVISISLYTTIIRNFSHMLVNNMAFYTLVLAQLLNVFNLPHRKLSFLRNEVISNPWVWGATFLSLGMVVLAYFIPFLNQALNLVPLNIEQILIICFFAGSSLVITQLFKRVGVIM